MGSRIDSSDFSGRRAAAFGASIIFALAAALLLMLVTGGQHASAASAAYTAYNHQLVITGTGGECASVGAWDQYQKSCTLNTDVADTTVWITGSGVTLNGVGHNFSGGADVTSGVIIGDNETGVTVENLAVSGFLGSTSRYKNWIGKESAIYQKPTSSGSTISGNSVISSDSGIVVSGGPSTVSGNTVSSDNLGIYLNGASNSTVTGNTANLDGDGIYLSAAGVTITGNTANLDTTAGIYLNSASNSTISGNTATDPAAGIDIAASSGNTISGNTLASSCSGCGVDYSVGINVISGSSNTISGNTDNGGWTSRYCITVAGTGSNIVKNNSVPAISVANNTTVTDNTAAVTITVSGSGNTLNSNMFGGPPLGSGMWAMQLTGSSNVFSGNVFNNGILDKGGHNNFSGNVFAGGIDFHYGSNETFSGNTFSGGSLGCAYSRCSNDLFYHNNIGNVAVGGFTSTSAFNLPAPTGGNYWSSFHTAAQGCVDANNDGFCDAPYKTDQLPLTTPVGAGKPKLTLAQPSAFWASLPDYQAGNLSVSWTVNNDGSSDAFGAQLTGSTNSSGVVLATAMPVTLGNGIIPAGSAATATLRYKVPSGVGDWDAAITGSAQDLSGATYIYP